MVPGWNIHDTIVGYIYVVNSALTSITDEQSIVNFSLLACAAVESQQVRVWYPYQAAPEPRLMSLTSADANGRYSLTLPVNALPPKARSNTFGERFKLNGR